jgi:hypothetical protein
MAIMWVPPIERPTGPTPSEITWRFWLVQALTSGRGETTGDPPVAPDGEPAEDLARAEPRLVKAA